jgi:DNA-binding MarR family transcriptional regulator
MHMHQSSLSPCICTSLRKATRAVTRLYDEAMAEAGMTIVQFSVLRHLARHGDQPLSRLAELLVMDRTTLYRALGPIERHGWVAITEQDGRTKLATLSEAGRRALAEAEGAWERVQGRLLDRIGADHWAELEGSLRGIVAATGAGA